ncbi:hypothetical protein [Cupriavidus sp. CP313]
MALIEALDRYLQGPGSTLPSLNAANGSHRQQRTERRVACIRLLSAQVKYVDLVSLRVGVPQHGGDFLNLTLRFLAKQAGLGLRRAERALADLQRAGLVGVWQRCQQTDNGQYRGLAAVKRLPAALFGAFGLGKWLRRERTKAQLRAQRRDVKAAKVRRQAEKERARGQLLQAGVATRLRRLGVGPARQAAAAAPNASEAAQFEYERAVQLRAAVLWEQHPEWGDARRERAYALARAELPPPGSLS